MDLSSAAGVLLIITAVLCVLLVILSIHLLLRVKKMERRYRRFMKGKDAISLEKKFGDEFDKLEKLDSKQNDLARDIRELHSIEMRNFTKYGIVKYDAFEDVGGRLSFALALLNDHDTGLVLNAIHSKDNCFLYLKEIVNGESYILLSNEEIEALQSAKRNDETDIKPSAVSEEGSKE